VRAVRADRELQLEKKFVERGTAVAELRAAILPRI
jgi:hypothetical protein